MSPTDDKDVCMPFGKYSGKPLHLITSRYLIWLTEQDWFEKKYPDLLEDVEWEITQRDKEGSHFYD